MTAEAKALNDCGLIMKGGLAALDRKTHRGIARSMAHDERCSENAFRLIDV